MKLDDTRVVSGSTTRPRATCQACPKLSPRSTPVTLALSGQHACEYDATAGPSGIGVRRRPTVSCLAVLLRYACQHSSRDGRAWWSTSDGRLATPAHTRPPTHPLTQLSCLPHAIRGPGRAAACTRYRTAQFLLQPCVWSRARLVLAKDVGGPFPSCFQCARVCVCVLLDSLLAAVLCT